MSLSKIITLTIVGIVIITGLIWFGSYLNYNNRDANLRNEGKAQNSKVELVYDEMYKIIHQTAEVQKQYSSDFKENVKYLMNGRYSKGDGSLMKFIQEQNPTLSPDMYKTVMDKIEAYRVEFTKTQERLQDIVREHDNLLTTRPSKWFVSDTTRLRYKLITSTRAKTVMSTGVDDDISVY